MLTNVERLSRLFSEKYLPDVTDKPDRVYALKIIVDA